MARRSFDVVDLTELFVHWEAGRSQVQIAQSLGLDPKTIRYADVGGRARKFVGGSDPGGGVAEVEAAGGVQGVFGCAGADTGG